MLAAPETTDDRMNFFERSFEKDDTYSTPGGQAAQPDDAT
jgi:hypothetical protein